VLSDSVEFISDIQINLSIHPSVIKTILAHFSPFSCVCQLLFRINDDDEDGDGWQSQLRSARRWLLYFTRYNMADVHFRIPILTPGTHSVASLSGVDRPRLHHPWGDTLIKTKIFSRTQAKWSAGKAERVEVVRKGHHFFEGRKGAFWGGKRHPFTENVTEAKTRINPESIQQMTNDSREPTDLLHCCW